MKNHLLPLLIAGCLFLAAYHQPAKTQLSEEETWRLGWRMIKSTIEANSDLAELQFDSLLANSSGIDQKFLITGLEVKNELGKTDELIKLLKKQDTAVLKEICIKQYLKKLSPCSGFSIEEVANKALQLELIQMYVNDQAARGNRMQHIINQYKLDTTQINKISLYEVDEINRNQLKKIIEKYGFPTKALVGRDAMNGIFLIIQHADQDKEWQRSQLKNIEIAVKNLDIDAQSYAYLFDRIKVNNGEKQVYGTQFAKVDPVNKIVKLAPTENIKDLDKRRMEIGMMPIAMYKGFMLQEL